MMSVRNMLKVVMSLLLATAIAATADTHAARVDQSPPSVAAAGKLNDKMPYLLCIRICTGLCICDKRPVEIAECTCSRPGDSAPSNKPAALLHTPEAALQGNGKSGPIPYLECIKTCTSCACTLKWPPESNICICLDDGSVPKNAPAVADRSDRSLASVTGKLDDKMPYLLCVRICIGDCVCDKRPVEYAECTCSRSGDSAPSNKPAALLHTPEAALQVNGRPDLIPYLECIKTCSKCACTKKWPPESNMCICLDDDSVPKNAPAVADRLDQSLVSVTDKAHELYEKLALLAGPAPKRTGGDDKKMVLWTTSKMEAQLPYKECIKTCKLCACTLIWPPEASTCVCMSPKPQAAGGKAEAK